MLLKCLRRTYFCHSVLLIMKFKFFQFLMLFCKTTFYIWKTNSSMKIYFLLYTPSPLQLCCVCVWGEIQIKKNGGGGRGQTSIGKQQNKKFFENLFTAQKRRKKNEQTLVALYAYMLKNMNKHIKHFIQQFLTSNIVIQTNLLSQNCMLHQ